MIENYRLSLELWKLGAIIFKDALSRRPDHCPAEDNDNEDMVLLPDNLFIDLIDVDL